MARGYSETVSLEDHSQILTRWKDNASVTLLSSALGDLPSQMASRYSRVEKKYMTVPQPYVIKQYNSKMGGVDRLDQNVNHLRVTIGGKKWYWSIVTWLLDASVQNAWLIHRKVGGSLSHLEFKREIVCVILRKAAATRSRNCSGSSTGRISRVGDAELRFDNIGHWPEVRVKKRKTCALEVCNAKIQTYCKKCDRALCLEHFEEYHCSG